MASQPRSERSLTTLEEAVAKDIAYSLSVYDAEVQSRRGRLVIYFEGVPFALYVENLT